MQLLSRALCAALALHAGVALAEQVPVHDVTGFTLTRNDLDPEVVIDFAFQTATSATFWLRGIEPNLEAATDSSYRPWNNDYRSFDAFYGITAKAGYRVTGITVSGVFHGELYPAQWTMPGDAGNALRFSLAAGAAEWETAHADDLHGNQSFTLSTGPTALEGEFSLAFHGSTDVWAESVFYLDEVSGEQYWLGSQASGAISGLTMTVDYAPVPEPATWAMLAGGMLALGGVRRLRRNVRGGGRR